LGYFSVGESDYERILGHVSVATRLNRADVPIQSERLNALELELLARARVVRDEAVDLQAIGARRDQVLLMAVYEVTVDRVLNARRRMHCLVNAKHCFDFVFTAVISKCYILIISKRLLIHAKIF
jgi:hypothetical protein